MNAVLSSQQLSSDLLRVSSSLDFLPSFLHPHPPSSHLSIYCFHPAVSHLVSDCSPSSCYFPLANPISWLPVSMSVCVILCVFCNNSFIFSLCKIKRVRKDEMQHTNPGNSASFPGVSDTSLTSSLSVVEALICLMLSFIFWIL